MGGYCTTCLEVDQITPNPHFSMEKKNENKDFSDIRKFKFPPANAPSTRIKNIVTRDLNRFEKVYDPVEDSIKKVPKVFKRRKSLNLYEESKKVLYKTSKCIINPFKTIDISTSSCLNALFIEKDIIAYTSLKDIVLYNFKLDIIQKKLTGHEGKVLRFIRNKNEELISSDNTNTVIIWDGKFDFKKKKKFENRICGLLELPGKRILILCEGSTEIFSIESDYHFKLVDDNYQIPYSFTTNDINMKPVPNFNVDCDSNKNCKKTICYKKKYFVLLRGETGFKGKSYITKTIIDSSLNKLSQVERCSFPKSRFVMYVKKDELLSTVVGNKKLARVCLNEETLKRYRGYIHDNLFSIGCVFYFKFLLQEYIVVAYLKSIVLYDYESSEIIIEMEKHTSDIKGFFSIPDKTRMTKNHSGGELYYFGSYSRKEIIIWSLDYLTEKICIAQVFDKIKVKVNFHNRSSKSRKFKLKKRGSYVNLNNITRNPSPLTQSSNNFINSPPITKKSLLLSTSCIQQQQQHIQQRLLHFSMTNKNNSFDRRTSIGRRKSFSLLEYNSDKLLYNTKPNIVEFYEKAKQMITSFSVIDNILSGRKRKVFSGMIETFSKHHEELCKIYKDKLKREQKNKAFVSQLIKFSTFYDSVLNLQKKFLTDKFEIVKRMRSQISRNEEKRKKIKKSININDIGKFNSISQESILILSIVNQYRKNIVLINKFFMVKLFDFDQFCNIQQELKRFGRLSVALRTIKINLKKINKIFIRNFNENDRKKALKLYQKIIEMKNIIIDDSHFSYFKHKLYNIEESFDYVSISNLINVNFEGTKKKKKLKLKSIGKNKVVSTIVKESVLGNGVILIAYYDPLINKFSYRIQNYNVFKKKKLNMNFSTLTPMTPSPLKKRFKKN